jgi:hypothetical protein
MQFHRRDLILSAAAVALLALIGYVVWPQYGRRLLIEKLQRAGAFVNESDFASTLPWYEQVIYRATRRSKASTQVIMAAPLRTAPVTDEFLLDCRFDLLRGSVNLEFEGSGVTDAGFRHLASAPRLHGLSVFSEKVGDGALDSLRQQPHLEFLAIKDCAVTDEGLDEVVRLRELTSLNISNTLVTDEGLAKLSVLPKLNVLVLDAGQVTDCGVEHLRTLPQLNFLIVFGCSTAKLKHLGWQPGASENGKPVWLRPPGRVPCVDDILILRLRPLSNLTSLSLYSDGQGQFGITDASVAEFAVRKPLRSLYIRGNRMTINGVSQVTAALPKAKVYSDYGE